MDNRFNMVTFPRDKWSFKEKIIYELIITVWRSRVMFNMSAMECGFQKY